MTRRQLAASLLALALAACTGSPVDGNGESPDYAPIFRERLDLRHRLERTIALNAGLPRGGAYVLRLASRNRTSAGRPRNDVYALAGELVLRDVDGDVLERLSIDEIGLAGGAWTSLGRLRLGTGPAGRVRSARLVLDTDPIGGAPLPWEVELYLRADPPSFFF